MTSAPPDLTSLQGALDEALADYAARERRFGRTSEQLAATLPQPRVG